MICTERFIYLFCQLKKKTIATNKLRNLCRQAGVLSALFHTINYMFGHVHQLNKFHKFYYQHKFCLDCMIFVFGYEMLFHTPATVTVCFSQTFRSVTMCGPSSWNLQFPLTREIIPVWWKTSMAVSITPTSQMQSVSIIFNYVTGLYLARKS